MDSETVRKILQDSILNLFANQPNIFDFTSETGQTEWNLAHHYANEIHTLISNYDCDLDVVKLNFDNRRPDIIFHSRGNHKSNFLIVEVKRDGDKAEIESDVQKIKSAWFKEPLRYRFGAVVNLMGDKTGVVKIFENR